MLHTQSSTVYVYFAVCSLHKFEYRTVVVGSPGLLIVSITVGVLAIGIAVFVTGYRIAIKEE